jgi:predicted DNA-binding protein with PD1-like motif
MKAVLLHEADGLRTFSVVLATGDEVMSSLTSFASERQLRATQLTAIGAFSSVVVAFFDWTTRQYQHTRIEEQVEVLSLLGDVTLEQGQPKVHAHVVIGKRDATAHGGHLIEALVRPTLEVMLTETPAHLRRRFDPDSGLALIHPTDVGRRSERT